MSVSNLWALSLSANETFLLVSDVHHFDEKNPHQIVAIDLCHRLQGSWRQVQVFASNERLENFRGTFHESLLLIFVEACCCEFVEAGFAANVIEERANLVTNIIAQFFT